MASSALPTRLPSARASRSRSAGDRRQVVGQVGLHRDAARARRGRGRATLLDHLVHVEWAPGCGRGMRANSAELVDDLAQRAQLVEDGVARLAEQRRRSARLAAAPSWSSARRSVSIESWMGKIGFFSSWARRRAISRQAATRSAWSSRSRDVAQLGGHGGEGARPARRSRRAACQATVCVEVAGAPRARARSGQRRAPGARCGRRARAPPPARPAQREQPPRRGPACARRR